MDLNNLAAANANISKFSVFSNYTGDEIDIRGSIARLYYYESILDNTVRMTINMVDGGKEVGNNNSTSKLEYPQSFSAGEKCNIIIEDGYNQEINLTNDYHLRVQFIRNIITDALSSSYTVDFYSEESIKNHETSRRVERRYEGKIHDSISKILKDYLDTPKNIYSDPTINDLVVYGNSKKPFARIHELATQSAPELDKNSLGTYAGYLFYENQLGYNFRSIDLLFKKDPVRKLIYNNTTGLPPGYDTKILKFSYNSVVNLEAKLLTGSMFDVELKTFNLYDNKYDGEKVKEFSSKSQLEDDDYTGGTEEIFLAKDLNIGATKTNFIVKDIGISNPGKKLETQLKKSKEVNFDIENIERQAKSRYNNLFTTKLSVTIPGDFSLKCGDLVYCTIAELSNKKNQDISDRNSGIYMIVDLCHYINSNPSVTKLSGKCFTQLSLVRDTFGRKPLKS